MIEIVFSDSAGGSLKLAQHYGRWEDQNVYIGVFVSHADGSKPTKEEIETAQREAEEKARLAWESATPLGGNPADIYGFNLALSIGDISENQPGNKRKQTLERLFSVYPNDVGHKAAQDIFKRVNADLEMVRERISTGEATRIWYSNQPDEMCGLFWFMWQLNQWEENDGQVFTVKLPEWETRENGNIVQINNWNELSPKEWNRYLDLQKPVLPAFRQYCAAHWQVLRGENASLRVVLNGQLVSASEKLYDDIIYREIASKGETFQEAMIIGRVLGKYQLGISDSLVALRIEEMIRAETLEVVPEVAEGMPRYHRTLKKCTTTKTHL